MQHMGRLDRIVVHGVEQVDSRIKKSCLQKLPREQRVRVQAHVVEDDRTQVTGRMMDIQDPVQHVLRFLRVSASLSRKVNEKMAHGEDPIGRCCASSAQDVFLGHPLAENVQTMLGERVPGEIDCDQPCPHSQEDYSDADWDVYISMRQRAEPIQREHLKLDTSQGDLDSAIEELRAAALGTSTLH